MKEELIMKKVLGIAAAFLTASALTISSYAADYSNIGKINALTSNSYNNSLVTPVIADITVTDRPTVGRYNTWLSKDQIGQLSSLDRAATVFLCDTNNDTTVDYSLTLTRQNAMLASSSILELNDNGVNLYVYFYPDSANKRFYFIPAQANAFGVCFDMLISKDTLSAGLTAAGISADANLSLYYENSSGETKGLLQELTKSSTNSVSFPLEYGYTYYIAAGASTVTEEELETLIDTEIKSAIGLTSAELEQNPTVKSYVDKVAAEIKATVADETAIAAAVDAYFTNAANLEKLAESMGFADGKDGLSAYQVAQADGYTGTAAQWLASLNGKSAYEIAKANGYTGTEAEWLASLTGTSGKSAYELAVAAGYTGTEAQWLASLTGTAGKSAYEIAVANGYKGTEKEWLASLSSNGESFTEWAVKNYGSIDKFIAAISGKSAYELAYAKDKTIGTEAQWLASLQGKNGLSAYEVAVTYGGYKGTMAQWLETLQGEDGLSAYALAVQNGYKGTLTQWLDSLKGADGQDGQDGQDGADGRDGQDGADGADGQDGRDGEVVYVNTGTGSGNTTGGTVIAGSTGSGTYNPKTGLAAGIIIPIASLASLIIYKKGKKRRR